MSAFGGKADMAFCGRKCPLMIQSEHRWRFCLSCCATARSGKIRKLRGASSAEPSRFYNHFKAAVDHALPIKGHGVYVRLHARIGHDLLHALVSQIARWPDDPRKDDRLVVLAFDCHRKRRKLPVGYIIS